LSHGDSDLGLGCFHALVLARARLYGARGICHSGFARGRGDGEFSHQTFAARAFRVQPAFGVIALALALLVFWSRLYLQRHDVPEMLTGTLLGMAGGVVTAWW